MPPFLSCSLHDEGRQILVGLGDDHHVHKKSLFGGDRSAAFAEVRTSETSPVKLKKALAPIPRPGGSPGVSLGGLRRGVGGLDRHGGTHGLHDSQEAISFTSVALNSAGKMSGWALGRSMLSLTASPPASSPRARRS